MRPNEQTKTTDNTNWLLKNQIESMKYVRPDSGFSLQMDRMFYDGLKHTRCADNTKYRKKQWVIRF